jgi:hypothetical protein
VAAYYVHAAHPTRPARCDETVHSDPWLTGEAAVTLAAPFLAYSGPPPWILAEQLELGRVPVRPEVRQDLNGMRWPRAWPRSKATPGHLVAAGNPARLRNNPRVP